MNKETSFRYFLLMLVPVFFGGFGLGWWWGSGWEEGRAGVVLFFLSFVFLFWSIYRAVIYWRRDDLLKIVYKELNSEEKRL